MYALAGRKDPARFRSYAVYGPGWHEEPLASKLRAHDLFLVYLYLDQDKLTSKAFIPLSAYATKLVRPERANDLAPHELFLVLSGPEEDQELRHIAANPLRLGAWAADRLGPILEEYLADHLTAD